MGEAMAVFREFMFRNIYHSELLEQERRQGIFVLEQLYDFFMKNSDRLPEEFRQRQQECSLQQTVVDILMQKLKKAARDLGIRQVAVAGGVSANSALRQAFIDYGKRYGWTVFIPPFSFTTDNAAMVCQAGYFKYLDGDFCPIDLVPYAKTRI